MNKHIAFSSAPLGHQILGVDIAAGVSDAHSVVVALGLDDGESEPQADTEGVAAALLETDAEASGLREDDKRAHLLRRDARGRHDGA